MKHLLFFITLLATSPPLLAQPASVPLAGQRQPFQVSVYPAYQSLTQGEQTITQLSVPLEAYLPLGRKGGLSLRTAWAQVQGDGLADLSGLTDAQGYLSFYQPLGRGSVVVGLGVNLPSGQRELTRDEFATQVLLSRNEYDFQTSSFGLGLGLSPGLTVAVPLGEAVVVGIGGAYQYHGAFEPLENMPEAYKPGDELLVTGGLDIRLTQALSWAADVTYTTYRPDEVGEAEVFEAGNKLVGAAQLRYRSRTVQSWLYARYRSRAKNSLAAADSALVEEVVKSLPDQVEVFAGVRTRLASSLVSSASSNALNAFTNMTFSSNSPGWGFEWPCRPTDWRPWRSGCIRPPS